MEPHLVFWIPFGICLLLSFFLSGMEAGVFALSRMRIRQQKRAGHRSAGALQSYLENPENFLWTILVGNTVVNFFILGWLVIVLRDLLRGNVLLFVIIYSAVVFLFYVLFDLLPKMLFRLYPNRLCLALALPFGIIHVILRPLVVIVESASTLLLKARGGTAFTGRLFGSREEMRLFMQESGQSLSSEERLMINRVLDLQSMSVHQAMVPMAKVTAMDSTATVADALEMSRRLHFTRLPVWETRGNARRISGILSLNTLLYQPDLDPSRPVSAYVRPAIFIDEDLRLELALRRMQRAGERLAIVLSRDRREVGVLSLQDVLRVIFGEVSL